MDNTKKPLAIIILNWNGESLLKKFLPAAVRDCISGSSDLIVADNGSSDNSVNFIRLNYPEVKVIEFKENLGFAGGYNRALKKTNYPFTLLLNSDVETTPGFWIPMLRYMERHPETAAMQPKLRSYYSKKSFEYAGAGGGFLDSLGFPYCRGRIMEEVEIDEGQYDGEPTEVIWATGAALMVNTRIYNELGGLDEKFFAHMEEIDLCCRMICTGYKVVAMTDAVVYHVGGASLPKGNPRKTYLNFRNNLLLLYKNLPAKQGARIIFIRRLVDTLAFIMYLLKGNWGDAKAVIKAHADYRKMKNLYQPAPDGVPRLLGKKSLLLNYYLKGRRKFSEL